MNILSTLNAMATYPNEDWGLVWSTVATGLVVVFLILVILIFVIWLLGRIFVTLDNRKKPPVIEKTNEPVIVNTQSFPVAAQSVSDDKVIIAVISAAIAAYGEEEGKQYKIKSIRKKEKPLRSQWGNAGVAESITKFNR